MQATEFKTQTTNYATLSKVAPLKPAQGSQEITATSPPPEGFLHDVLTHTGTITSTGNPGFGPVFFGTPEECVKETVEDILKAKESGKNSWCGTPMMMGIMAAHDRFAYMVSQQPESKLEDLREFIVKEMNKTPDEEARKVLLSLYNQVDSALPVPQHFVQTGCLPYPSEASRHAKDLDKAADQLVEMMATTSDKANRSEVFENYANLRNMSNESKDQVNSEQLMEKIKKFLPPVPFHPPTHWKY